MEDRTFVEWDKDDLDALGILKVDVLGLGMLTCMRKAFELTEKHYRPPFRLPYRLAPQATDDRCREISHLATIPPEDPAVYRMLQRADSLGVFQVESRAQMSMLPRLKPKKFYDLVIEVAIVRPGPDPGRHGASLSAPPAGHRAGRPIRRRSSKPFSARRSACRCSRSRR